MTIFYLIPRLVTSIVRRTELRYAQTLTRPSRTGILTAAAIIPPLTYGFSGGLLAYSR